MAGQQITHGFSSMSRDQKMEWLREAHDLSPKSMAVLDEHLHPRREYRERYASFSENSMAEYHLPFSLAPNFLVNGNMYTLPMVCEESSVVAAASHAAKFWAGHGGYSCLVEDTLKHGQVHFRWTGEPRELERLFQDHQARLLQSLQPITRAMETRGGGISSLELKPTSDMLPGSYQLFLGFRTADAMGANFINTVLEALAMEWEGLLAVEGARDRMEISMAILSNYTPECRVRCRASIPVGDLAGIPGVKDPEGFARQFILAADIAREDIHRAVTHNKGILNGMDALILATGNDFRAVEACAHAWASRDGRYRSLSRAWTEGGQFIHELEVPFAVGTVGGLTGNHPLAAAALDILGNPGAELLMMLIAAAGLANNFSALRSLVTTGIQQGHMKMHLENILLQLGADALETAAARQHFSEGGITHAAVKVFLENHRKTRNA